MLRFLGELRYGFRLLVKDPIFSMVAMLTIALGTGASVAIFTVINSTLLNPLPYEDSEEITMVWWTSATNNTKPISPADFYDWQQQSKSFESLAAYHPWSYTLTGQGEPERLRGAVLTAGLLELLRAETSLGRSFDADGPDAPAMVILSDDLWQRSFGSDPDVLGKKLLLDDQPYEVVGVMPASFRFPLATPADVWVVSPYGVAELPRDMRFLRVLGRLKSGLSLDSAGAEMSAIAARLADQFPDTNAGLETRLVPLRETMVSDFRQGLLYLQIAVLLALAIACFNVAMLQLARGSVRRGEVAMRLALGATRFQLFRQLLIENLLLGLCGGAAGLAVAYAAVRLLVRFGPADIYRLEEAAIDGRVLAFALAVTLLSVLVFGLAPAAKASRDGLRAILGQARHSSVGDSWAREAFAFLQVAITLVLLVGAGLLIRSLEKLNSVSPGFRTENLLTMKITLQESKATVEQTAAFYREIKERVEKLPGVESFATSFYLPLGGGMNVGSDFEIEGRPSESAGQAPYARIRPVSPDFLTTMEIPLVLGRTFTEHDTADAPGVVVINQTTARTYWPGVDDPIGELLKVQIDLGADVGSFAHESWEIVGVVGDIKHKDLESATQPEIYFSTLQGPWRETNLIVRTQLEPADLIKPVAAEVHAMAPELPVVQVRTMAQIIADSLNQPQFNTWLLSVFAAFALGLTVIGLYGILSYSVHQRTREIGLRMALGAGKLDVLRLVVGRGMMVVAAGLAAGLVGAFFVVRLLTGLLFGVSSTDPATFAGVVVILTLVALMASYLPARRAAGLDPMTTLRHE